MSQWKGLAPPLTSIVIVEEAPLSSTIVSVEEPPPTTIVTVEEASTSTTIVIVEAALSLSYTSVIVESAPHDIIDKMLEENDMFWEQR